MKLEKAINKYFSRENIIDNICKYQLYYQLGLGSVVYQSLQDLEETHKKLEELNLQINTQKVFETIHQIILHLSREDNFEEKFENHLKFSALAQMLDDFIETDKELLNSKQFTDTIYEQIKDDKFFTDDIKQQFDNDYETIFIAWEATITEDIANEIKDVVTDIFDKK